MSAPVYTSVPSVVTTRLGTGGMRRYVYTAPTTRIAVARRTVAARSRDMNLMLRVIPVSPREGGPGDRRCRRERILWCGDPCRCAGGTDPSVVPRPGGGRVRVPP